MRPDGSRDRLGVLRDELKRHHLRVSRLHAKLFYQPLLESLAPEGLEFSQGMTPAAAERQLAALGYEAPHSALTHLAALINQSGRRGRVQSVLLPRLLDWLSDTPDPDGGLLAYRRISEVMVSQRWYLSTLRDKPSVAKRLMHVLGTSAYVPELLMRAPEVVQNYSDGPSGPKLLEVEPARWPAHWWPRPAGRATRFARSRSRVHCAAASWPASHRPTCWACSTSPMSARR